MLHLPVSARKFVNKVSTDYTWADAWFLLAVSYVSPKGEEVKLSDVIGAADYINHAILSVAEIKSATFKLTGDQWIIYQSGQFSATDKMIEKFSKLPAKSPMAQMEIVESWLAAAGYGDDYDPDAMSAPDVIEITEEMVDLATAEYNNQGRKN